MSTPDVLSLNRPLTKSRFKMAMVCPTKLYYVGKPAYGNSADEDSFLEGLAQGGFQVGELAKLLFPGGREVARRGYAKQLEETRALLDSKDAVIYEAAFSFENLFLRADIVRRSGHSLDLIEVKAKSWDPEEDSFWNADRDRLLKDFREYLEDIAFQYYVVTRARPDLRVSPFLCLANKRAVASVDGVNGHFVLRRSEDGSTRVEVSPPGLTATELGVRLLIDLPVHEEVNAIMAEPSFEARLREFAKSYRNDTKITPTLSRACKKCEFRIDPEAFPGKRSGFEECWGGADPRRPRVFDLWDFKRSDDMISRGIRFLDELQDTDLEPKQKKKMSQNDESVTGLTRIRRQSLQIEKAR